MRKWHEAHIDAGYHLQEWVIPTPVHSIIGTYNSPEGPVKVRYLSEGPTGVPEFEIEWSSGMKVTVLDYTVVEAYLKESGVTLPSPSVE